MKRITNKGIACFLCLLIIISTFGTVAFAVPISVGVTYQSHIQDIGWQAAVSNGQVAGTQGLSLRMEALKINLVGAPAGASIKYEVHVATLGWQSLVSDGQIAGSVGQGLQMEAVKITLENMPGYSVRYQVHVAEIGWQAWVSDGQIAGTTGRSLRIEAIRIILEKISDNTSVNVQYQSHVKDIGWQTVVSNGQIAGTEGLSLRMEALRINLVGAPIGGSVNYEAHVATIGWQSIVSDGQLAGTVGRGLQIEAIRISLVNMPAYSVQYQGHVAEIGWQPWVSDGQIAGTTGSSRELEAIRIRIVSNPLYVAAELAVAAYETTPITTLTEISAAEGLKPAADTAVAAIGDAASKAAFELRISIKAAAIAAAKATLLVADAIAAINNAPDAAVMSSVITTYAITSGLNLIDYNALPDASKVVVQTAMIAPTFTSLAQLQTTFDAAVLMQKALVAVNTASTVDMGSVISTYSTALGLNSAVLADYGLLSPAGKDIVHTAMVGKAFADTSAVNTAFGAAVSVQIINEITVNATMGSAITRYAGILSLDATAYSTYTAPSVNSASFKNHINAVLMAAVMPTAADVQAAFAAAVMAEAVHTIDIQVFNFMERDLRTYSVILGLNLTDFDTLINKNAVLTAMVTEPFATVTHVKEFFDALVTQQKELESLPMLEAFNTAPDAATMGNVLAIYQTLFNATDYNAYSNFIGTVAQTAIQTSMLTPTFLTEKDIQMAFVIGLVNNAFPTSGKQIFANNVTLLGLATSTVSNEFTLLPYAEQTIITNAVFAARPIADQTGFVVIAFNNTTTENYIGTLITLNSGLFSLDLAVYNTLSPTDMTTVHQAMIAASLNSAADVQTAFNAAMAVLTYVPAVGTATAISNTSTITYTLTTETFHATEGIVTSNWILGGASVADLGTITNIVLSNSDTTATLSISGTAYQYVIDYTVSPALSAITTGYAAPAAATITMLDPLAVGGAIATTGTSTITYALSTGTFDPIAGIVAGNWIIGGVDLIDLGSVSSVVLSNSDKTATLTVSGTVGSDTKVYTVTPVQAMFTMWGYTAPGSANVTVTADILAAGTATAIANTSTMTYTLTTGTFDATAGIVVGNWTLGGTYVADLGTISNIVLSNGDTTATISYTGIAYQYTVDYTVSPEQATFSPGFAAPAAAYITVLNPLAVGGAIATTGTNTITYALTSGTYDNAEGIVNGNWILGGTDAGDLGSILSVVLSNSDKTATITVSGTVGTSAKVYTIAPAQIMFTQWGYTAPAAADIAVTTDTLAIGTATAEIYTSTITYILTTGTFDATAGIVVGNWTLGGTYVADLGTISNIVLSNGDTTATLSITGVAYPLTIDYSATPAQTTFTAGFAAPAPAMITLLNPPAVGGATAVTGSNNITYDLTTGTFDPIEGTVVGNWALSGADAGDLGAITNVALSNFEMTATITVSGTVGANLKDYTITPAQIMFTLPGFREPAAASIVVTP